MSLDPPPLKTRFWKVVDPEFVEGSEAESLRFDLAREESHLKALGTLCYVLGFLWSLNQLYYSSLLYLHILGTVSAPWIMEPYWIVLNTLQGILVALAIVTGFGLRGLRRWSLNLGLAFGLVNIFDWSLQWTSSLWRGDHSDALLSCIGGTLYLIPLTILVRPSIPTLLSPGYASAVEQTPYIRIRAKLPLGIKLTMLLVVLVTIILAVVLHPQGPQIVASSAS